MDSKERATAREPPAAGAGGRQGWPSDIGLALLLADHFAQGRRLAGLAGFAGTAGVQAAAAFGVLDVDRPRLFALLAVYGVAWSLVVWLVPWDR